MWPFKKRESQVPDDVGQAQERGAHAEAAMAEVERRTGAVVQMGSYLADRRQQNHFGESIQITFTPRRGNA